MLTAEETDTLRRRKIDSNQDSESDTAGNGIRDIYRQETQTDDSTKSDQIVKGKHRIQKQKAKDDKDVCKLCKGKMSQSVPYRLRIMFVHSFAYSLAFCISVLIAWVVINNFIGPTIRNEGQIEPDPIEQMAQEYMETWKNSKDKPGLTRIRTQKVNESVPIFLEPGKMHVRITRSINPPIFEIPNFLTDEEINHIIHTAKEQGLQSSTLFRAGDITVEKDLKTKDPKLVDRISSQTWLTYTTEVLRHLRVKLSRLTQLPKWIIDGSEQLQVVTYGVGGHYHAHLDSTAYSIDKPCCHQATCDRTNVNCCRLCRYATVLYYLNDVDEGGETAFPYADKPEHKSNGFDYNNLSYNCYNASLVVKPKKGTAIFWYNHHMDERTFFLDDVDYASFHGGCDIIKGTKWIANSWISAPNVEHKDNPTTW